MKKQLIGVIALTILLSSGHAMAKRDDPEELSTWEENRKEYLDNRDEYYDGKKERYNKYKTRLGNNKYRQKAREFYGRSENIYDRESEEEIEDRENK